MKRAIIFFFIITFRVYLYSQSIVNWLLDPVGSAANYVISNTAEKVWDEIQESNIRSSLSSDAIKIANFPIDSSKLSFIDQKYQTYTYGQGNYALASTGLNQLIKHFFQVSLPYPLNDYANGRIMSSMHDYINNKQQKLKNCNQLDVLLAAHPELQGLRDSWSNIPFLHNNVQQLYYWGILIKKRPKNLPSRYTLSSTDNIIIQSNGIQDFNNYDDDSNFQGTIYDKSTSESLGTIQWDPNQHKYIITVHSLSLLNYQSMPNAIYHVQNVTYTTDILGRVIIVKQRFSSACKVKSVLNDKSLRINQFTNNEEEFSYPLADLKYNGTVSNLNLVIMTESSENRSTIRKIRKNIKNILKSKNFVDVTSVISYSSNKTKPTNIEVIVCRPNEIFILNNNAPG